MSTPTQKQQLDDALAKIADLEPKANASADLQVKLDEANGKLSAAEKLAGDEKARADKAEGDLTASEEKLIKAGDDLKAANEKLGAAKGERDNEKKRADDAENKLKNADQTHAEQSASGGIKPFKKAAAGASTEGNAKPTAAEMKEQYAAIEDKTERYAFFEKNRAALMS